MKKNNLYAYIAVSLAILVPVPGRFACGIILMIAVNFFMLTGTLFRKLIYKLSLQNLQPILIAIFLMAMAIIYKQLLILYSPVLALVLGLSLYMCAISSFMIGCLYEKSEGTLASELKVNMSQSGAFTVFSLLYFLFRDIFGYGTITFPEKNGFYSLVLFSDKLYFSPSIFWASVPGALVLTAIILVIFVHINKKLDIVETTLTAQKDGETTGEEKK
jgi:hypothetical protein